MKIKQSCIGLMKKISDYLKDLKVKKGYFKHTELIDLMGVKRSFITDWINDKATIKAGKCLIIAEELGVKPELILITMLYEKEKNSRDKEELSKIIERLEKDSN